MSRVYLFNGHVVTDIFDRDGAMRPRIVAMGKSFSSQEVEYQNTMRSLVTRGDANVNCLFDIYAARPEVGQETAFPPVHSGVLLASEPEDGDEGNELHFAILMIRMFWGFRDATSDAKDRWPWVTPGQANLFLCSISGWLRAKSSYASSRPGSYDKLLFSGVSRSTSQGDASELCAKLLGILDRRRQEAIHAYIARGCNLDDKAFGSTFIQKQ